MADIKFVKNQALERRGQDLVRGAKDHAAARKNYSHKEIAQSVKEATGFMRSKAIDRTYCFFEPKPINTRGLSSVCQIRSFAWHGDCSGKCSCKCHKTAVNRKRNRSPKGTV